MDLKNKKAQAGSALSWIVGVLIIFFVLIFFVGATLWMAGKQKIEDDRPELNLIGNKQDLVLTKIMVRFLNSETDSGRIKEVIRQWSLEEDKKIKKDLGLKISNKFLEIQAEKPAECYFLQVGNEILQKKKPKEAAYWAKAELFNYKGEIIHLNFYLGGCANEKK